MSIMYYVYVSCYLLRLFLSRCFASRSHKPNARTISFSSLSLAPSFSRGDSNIVLLFFFSSLPVGIDVAVFEHTAVLSSRLVDFTLDGLAVVF